MWSFSGVPCSFFYLVAGSDSSALPGPSCECHILFPAELSRSSWLSSTAFIPAARYLSLEPPTGLTSWTPRCSGRAGTSPPTLPHFRAGL